MAELKKYKAENLYITKLTQGLVNAIRDYLKLGDVNQLQTTDKTSIVGAINEVKKQSGTIQDSTLAQKGIVQLTNDISDNDTLAITPKGVNTIKKVADTNKTAIGALGSLTTNAKNNLVEAINELKTKSDKIPTIQDGTLSQKGIIQLTNTIDESENKAITPKAVNTIKKVADTNKTSIGALSSLSTSKKDNLVNAINEVTSKIVSKLGDRGLLKGFEGVETLNSATATINASSSDIINITNNSNLTITFTPPTSGKSYTKIVSISGGVKSLQIKGAQWANGDEAPELSTVLILSAFGINGKVYLNVVHNGA